MSFLSEPSSSLQHRAWNWEIPYPASAFVFAFSNQGFDNGGDAITPSVAVNSDAAWLDFEAAALGGGYVSDVQDFEAVAFPQNPPLVFVLTPGAPVTCTLSGGIVANGAGLAQNLAGGTDANGRYSVPVGATLQFWRMSDDTQTEQGRVTFSSPVSGVSLWLTDVGDFGGLMDLEFYDAAGLAYTATVSLPAYTPPPADPTMEADLIFIGVMATTNCITSMRFINPPPGLPLDVFGIDLLTVWRL